MLRHTCLKSARRPLFVCFFGLRQAIGVVDSISMRSSLRWIQVTVILLAFVILTDVLGWNPSPQVTHSFVIPTFGRTPVTPKTVKLKNRCSKGKLSVGCCRNSDAWNNGKIGAQKPSPTSQILAAPVASPGSTLASSSRQIEPNT